MYTHASTAVFAGVTSVGRAGTVWHGSEVALKSASVRSGTCATLSCSPNARATVRRLAHLCLPWAAATLLGFGAARAHAYEDKYTLGGDLGYAGLSASSSYHHGLSIGLSSSLGLSEVWTARARLALAALEGDDRLYVGSASAELMYILDVAQVVPSFGLGTSGLWTLSDSEMDPALHGVVSLDWLLSFTTAVGVDVRAYVLPMSLSERPFLLMTGLRFSVLFDR